MKEKGKERKGYDCSWVWWRRVFTIDTQGEHSQRLTHLGKPRMVMTLKHGVGDGEDGGWRVGNAGIKCSSQEAKCSKGVGG